MSDEENKDIVTETAEEKKFWLVTNRYHIFNLFTQGKDVNTIAETLSLRPLTVEQTITNKFFIAKLEQHIKGVLFTNQVAKVIAANDIFSKLWDRVTNNIDEIPPEICLKELTKMFPRKREGVLINPKSMNVFMKVMKGEVPASITPYEEEDDAEMGFEGLEDDDDAFYPELGEGQEDDGEQQGDPEMDPAKPNKDE